jgi:hypothetical protein
MTDDAPHGATDEPTRTGPGERPASPIDPTSAPGSSRAAGGVDPTAAAGATAVAPVDPVAQRRRRAAFGVGAAAVAFALLIVAIVRASGSDPVVASAPPATTAPPATEPVTEPEPVVTATEPPPTEPGTTTTTRKPRAAHTGPPGPLTGTPVERAGFEQRPALVLKIDNYDPDARPQAGLTRADVVYEEKVEGPYSRFAAVFQGSDAEKIGPIRSARSTDVAIAGPLQHPLFGYSGANGGFQAILPRAPSSTGAGPVRPTTAGATRSSPTNLYTSTALLSPGMRASPHPDLGVPLHRDLAGAAPRRSLVSYHFGGGVTSVNWAWSPEENGWVRTQNGSVHYDQDNWPVTAENLVVQHVPYVNPSPTTCSAPHPRGEPRGHGPGGCFTNGGALPITWSRYALEEPTQYFDGNGEPLRFAPGRTWVILVPAEIPATVRFADGTAAS